MTTRLGTLLSRIGEVWTTLPCPDCRGAVDAPGGRASRRAAGDGQRLVSV